MNKKEFALVWDLQKKHHWLKRHENGVMNLLTFFKSAAERDLILSLIDRFSYFDIRQMYAGINSMANQIVNNWGLTEEGTIISAITKGNSPCSSQAILQFLKKDIGNFGWDRPRMTNSMNPLKSELKKMPSSNLVFVDDFSGSGTTIVSSINQIKKYAVEKDFKLTGNIYVCLLACMENARLAINAAQAEVFFCHFLQKGISDFLVGADRKKAVDVMLEMESVLDPKAGNEEFHSMGYKQSEAIFYFEESNASNNVFPVFWWKYLLGGKKRPTLLQRVSG